MPRHQRFARVRMGICLVFFLFFALTARAATDGEKLRRFVYDMVTAMSAKDRPTAMRRVFADHPEIATWLAQGRDFKQLMKEADLPTQGLTMDVVDLTLGNFEIMLKSELGKASGLVDGFHQFVDVVPGGKMMMKLLPETAAKAINVAMNTPVGKQALLTYAGLGHDQRLALMQLVPSAPLDAAGKQLDEILTKTQPEDIPAMQPLLGKDGAKFDIPELSAKGNEKLKEQIIGYFRIMPLEEKKRIMLAVLELPPNSPIENQLSAAVLATGPVFEKLLQLVKTRANSPEVEKAAELVYDSVTPFPTEDAIRIIENNLGKPIKEVFSEFNPEPIKTGTMAQTYSAVLRSTGKKVAIKVRRPEALEKGLEEISRLYKLAEGDPVATDMIRKLEAAFRNECDLVHEAANARRAKRVYTDGRNGIEVAAVTRGLPKAVFNDMLVLHWANGRKLDFDIKDPASLVKEGEAVSRLLNKFVQGAIWDRYAHADLHPGNTLYQTFDQNWWQRLFSKVGLGRPDTLISVIDHGSGGDIPAKVRRGIAKMCFGLVIRSTDDFLSAAKDMGMVITDEKGLKPAIDKIMANPDLLPLDRMSAITGVLQDVGVYLPYHLLLFNRARMFLESDLKQINENLDKIDPKHQYKRFNLHMIYARSAVEGMLGQFINMVTRRNKTPVPVTASMTADFMLRGIARFIRGAPRPVVADIKAGNGCPLATLAAVKAR